MLSCFRAFVLSCFRAFVLSESATAPCDGHPMTSQRLVVLICFAATSVAFVGCTSPIATDSTSVQPDKPLTFRVDHPATVWRDSSSPIVMVVPVVNRTHEVVIFSNFACSCGCTTGGLEKTELRPGESTKVTMVVNGQGRHGLQRFLCHWVDQRGEIWTAEARTAIYQPVRFEPTVIHLARRAKPGSTSVGEATLEEYAENTNDLSPEPTLSVEFDGSTIRKSSSTIETLDGNCVRRRTPVSLALTVPKQVGYGSAIIRVGHSGAANVSAASLTVDWSVEESVVAEPRQLSLSFGPHETVAEDKIIKLTGAKGAPVLVTKVRTSDPNIVAELVDGGNTTDGVRLKVSVQLATGNRLLAGWVSVEVSQPDATEVRIPIAGFRQGE